MGLKFVVDRLIDARWISTGPVQGVINHVSDEDHDDDDHSMLSEILILIVT